jgi:DNA-directed RNA polymerase subunit RPC12/RpoP
MNIALNLQIPVKLMCVSCKREIASVPGTSICVCPGCGFKVMVIATMGLIVGEPQPKGPAPALKRPPPVA